MDGENKSSVLWCRGSSRLDALNLFKRQIDIDWERTTTVHHYVFFFTRLFPPEDAVVLQGWWGLSPDTVVLPRPSTNGLFLQGYFYLGGGISTAVFLTQSAIITPIKDAEMEISWTWCSCHKIIAATGLLMGCGAAAELFSSLLNLKFLRGCRSEITTSFLVGR